VMLPFLKLLADQKEHVHNVLITELSNHFKLTEEERLQLVNNGKQPVIYNRVGWARTYLKKAGLLISPKRGTHIITQRGLDLLKSNPEKIDVRLLKQFPEFIQFISTSEDGIGNKGEDTFIESKSTPDEIIEKAYLNLRNTLAEDLLAKVKAGSPSFFEGMVVELLVKMGYGGSLSDAGSKTRLTRDEGIDGIIKEDKLGLDVIYIQAKRWEANVGRPEIQKFVGALAGQGAKKGIIITTSDFSKDAFEYLPKNEFKIVLINGYQLAQYMIDYNLGVSIEKSFEIKKVDNDYFEEE
jgi:restriction system protein